MSNLSIANIVTIGIIAVPVFIGVIRFREFDIATKIFWGYSCLGLTGELIALYAAYEFKNNMAVYGIYGFLEIGLMSLYFTYSNNWLKRYGLGYIIGAFGICLGILNSCFLQPLNTLNSYFIYFEGILIIALSLFSFFRILLLSEDVKMAHLRHFWFPVILCFYWSCTFFVWGMYPYFAANMGEWMWLFNLLLRTVGVITYLSIAAIFWWYPKLKATDE